MNAETSDEPPSLEDPFPSQQCGQGSGIVLDSRQRTKKFIDLT